MSPTASLPNLPSSPLPTMTMNIQDH